jgi:hypothetical protein
MVAAAVVTSQGAKNQVLVLVANAMPTGAAGAVTNQAVKS